MKKVKWFSLMVIFLMSLCWLREIQKIRAWTTPDGVISSDVISYYGYLPAVFIYHDISLRFKDDPSFSFKDKIWAAPLPGNHYVIRMSMGLSMLYMPFFLVAHSCCKIMGLPANGFSDPYELALLLSSFFYTILGFVFLRKILSLYFSDIVVSICLVAIGLGTNLFNYVTLEACMSHAYLFCLFNIFIWLTYKWYEHPSLRLTLLIGLAGGLTSLVRPTHMLIFLIFILYGIHSISDIFKRVRLLLVEGKTLVRMASVVLMVWLPQLAYWKFNTGSWFFFSYIGSHFYFLQPHILDGLFSYRKGWLLYTPIMILSLLGFFFMKRKIPSFFTGSILFFIISTYIMLSWWCWWYGGSFGQRPFIDMYGLLALPMGCLITTVFEKAWWKRVLLVAVMTALIAIQLFQSKQYYWGSIHWDSMTKEAYWASFLKKSPPPGWQYLLKEPDYEGARENGREAK